MDLIYKCKNCNETFNNKGELYNHQKEIHNIVNNVGKQPKYNLTCKFCGITKFICKSGMTFHENHCDKNPNKIPYHKYTMSESGKKHISEGMKKAAKEGRNRGWTTTKCGPQNKSYPEKFFTKVIEDEFEDKNYVYNAPFYTWKLDFAWPCKKLCIEIDGSQHERLEKQKESDSRKDEKLKNEGWKVLRIKWIDMFHKPKEYIKQAKEFVDTGNVISCEPYINPCKIKNKNSNKNSNKTKNVNNEKHFLKDKSGRYNNKVLAESIWLDRKEKILNSNVNLKEYGWQEKVSKLTGLTRRIIYKTIEHFKNEFEHLLFKRKS